jgi:hypothetical protein
MMNEKTTLKQLLETSEGKQILFLGKEGIFTAKEIERFLKKYKIITTTYLEEGVVAVVEHHRLSPVEEDISNDAYDQKLPLFKLDEFEQLLSEEINDDELLMGIKLVNDQARIYRLLGNESISNALFVKLLRMYEWDDDEEDSRDDRDVIMYTLSRYIDIKPNEQDLLYSYLTLRRLATEATDPRLLEALIGFPNFKFLVRGKENITLRETIARNPHIDREVIQKLLSFRDIKVNASLSANPATPLETLQYFAKSNDERVQLYLASNRKIDQGIFEILLEKREEVVHELLRVQDIDMQRLKAIEERGFDDSLFAVLGANRYLSKEVLAYLLQSDNRTLIAYLSANDELPASTLEMIYERRIEESYSFIVSNPSLPVVLLESLYKKYGEQKEILISLALNPSAPEKILRELFEKEDLDINRGLATNASLPMELLDHLKIDTRLQNELAENPVFIKEYETVLDYDKEAVQF